jgi:alpha 1,2-mannosyltransferase
MHWLTIVFIVILSILLVSLVVLLGFMLTSRPTEVNRLANGKPNQDKLKKGPSIYANEYDRKVSTMNDDQLMDELQRVIDQIEREFNTAANLPNSIQTQSVWVRDPTELEQNTRSTQLLSAISQTNDAVPIDRPVGTGRGIVICAGGFEYGTDAFVLVKLLRKKGCSLPIEIWHRTNEMCPEMHNVFEELQCTLRDIDAVSSITFPNRFAIKPLAVYYSAFAQVLLLDADNITICDPEYLFEQLSETQPAIFWPDHWPLDKNALCYKTFTDEQVAKLTHTLSQDSGQLLIDKNFCMKALSVCMKINVQLHSQLKRLFPEPFNGGDKDTWNYAWIKTNTPFVMMPHRPGGVGVNDGQGQYIGTTLVQFDINHQPVFLHKLRSKWAKEILKPQWLDYMRFLHPYPRGRVHQWTQRFEDGPVEKGRFQQKFGNLEDECWEALDWLRKQDWYVRHYAAEIKDIGL